MIGLTRDKISTLTYKIKISGTSHYIYLWAVDISFRFVPRIVPLIMCWKVHKTHMIVKERYANCIHNSSCRQTEVGQFIYHKRHNETACMMIALY